MNRIYRMERGNFLLSVFIMFILYILSEKALDRIYMVDWIKNEFVLH